MLKTLEPILQEHPFFANLGAERIRLLAGCAKNVRVVPGKFLFREREAADAFYLIREGTLSLELASPRTGPIIVETVGAGDVVGWSWLFPPYRWHFDARVTEPCRLVSLDGACLRKKCEADTSLGYELMQRFASLLMHRLQSTRIRLVEASEEIRVLSTS